MAEAERKSESFAHEGVRVILLGDRSPLFDALAKELTRTGLSAEIAGMPQPGDARASASRAVIFVELGAGGKLDSAWIAAWRERLPDAAVIALAEDLDGDTAARMLATGVTSIPKPVAPAVLAELVHSLAQQPESSPASSVKLSLRPAGDLSPSLEAYALFRALSRQQRLILGFYLGGSNDKAIAERCGCSEATVYEHWRRMAKKAGGTHKADAINDFHRFLAGT